MTFKWLKSARFCIVVSITAFAFMHTVFKLQSIEWSPLHLIFMRGLGAMPFIFFGLLWARNRSAIFSVNWSLQFMRALLGASALFCFIYALSEMAMVQAFSIAMTAPLLVCLLGVLLFKEALTQTIVLASVIGLLGTVVVLRPSSAGLWSWAALASLMAAVAYAFMVLLTRRLTVSDGQYATFFWHTIMLTAITGFALVMLDIPVVFDHFALCLLLGLLACTGQLFLLKAYHLESAPKIVNWEFLTIPISFLLDWMIWQQWPSIDTLIGSALIALSVTITRK